MKRVILTGVKPTGTPHVGNFFGAIKPAIELGADFLFIADYHALTTVKNAKELQGFVREIACTWLACGLDPSKTIFYKQSDIPEIFELAIILANITPKGLLNRAHAYKAIVQAAGDESTINMGLFNYPILQSADILAFGTTHVPVGQDQKQHIEICADIAKAFNAKFGQNLPLTSIFKPPEALIQPGVATIPGLDGRKMSKSYGNQIPLFVPPNELKKYIMRITTDSSTPTEPKPTDHVLFGLYSLFATPAEVKTMRTKFQQGIGWGEVKSSLFEVANRTLTPMRERYEYYMKNYGEVEKILNDGAVKAREVARKTLDRVRKAVGV